MADGGPVSSTAGFGLTSGQGNEILLALFAAEIVGLPIPIRMKGGGFVHGHPASRVFGEIF
jgi:hypothetical protein